MARNLDTEKQFLVITNIDGPMHDAYRIMHADIVSFDDDYDVTVYGTVICISNTDERFKEVAIKCTCRFFGILVDPYVIRTKKDYVPSAKAESAYIGVPTSHDVLIWPDDYWGITYPHITLVPPTHKIHTCSEKLFPVEYFMSEILMTENTCVHHVLFENDAPHHITRAVRNGMKPVIAGKEVIGGTQYTECRGHSVIM